MPASTAWSGGGGSGKRPDSGPEHSIRGMSIPNSPDHSFCTRAPLNRFFIRSRRLFDLALKTVQP